MHPIAAGFLAGILVVQQLSALPSLAWTLLAVPLLLAYRWPRLLAFGLAALAGAMWVTLRADAVLADRLDPALEGADLLVEGIVADIPKPADFGLRFPFDVRRAFQDGVAVQAPQRVLLNLYQRDYAPKAGEMWRLSVRLKRPHGFQNPGGYDYEARLFHERVRATGYVRMDEDPVLIDATPAWYGLQRFRGRLSGAIRSAIASSPVRGMIVAFANGDETGIADAQWDVLARTGTTHLVAISGMNIGLVAGIAFFLARFLWALPGVTVLWLPAQHAGAVAALCAGTGYAALAGFAIPTQRALVMLAVALLGILMRRPLAVSRILACALFAVLVYDPLAVMDAGFWLSFLAVAVLIMAGRDMPRAARWRERAWQFGRLQWAVTIGLFPVLLAMQQQANVIAPVANLAAVPVIEIAVIPLTLAGVVAIGAGLDWIAHVMLSAAVVVLEFLWHLLEMLAGFSWSLVYLPSPPVWAYACALVGILLLLAPRGFPARYVGIVWMLPLLLPPRPSPDTSAWDFAVLDVGQGLATIVRTANHTLVYDAGPRANARFDSGRTVVAPYLRAKGIGRIDRLVVSHGDNDHAGGVAHLRSAFPVGAVQTSDPGAVPGAEICHAGMHWEWDGVVFEMLFPDDAAPGEVSDNNRSCVLRVSGPGGSVLLPGDIEAEAEALLVESGVPLATDILVAPHHGSKTSSTDEFVAAVHPAAVVFATGYRNRFRHPHRDVVARYRDAGVQRFDSPRDGAVEFHFTAAGWTVSRYRHDRRRYWWSEL